MTDTSQVASPATDAVTTTTTPEAAAPAPVTTEQTPPSSWLETLQGDTKAYAELKGWQNPAAAVESYRNAEKYLGVPHEQIIKLPKPEDTKGWEQVWQRLGAPEKAESYEINVPEEVADPDLANWARAAFHELKIPRKQAEALINKWTERTVTNLQKEKAELDLSTQKVQEELKREWGQAYEQNVGIVDQVAHKLGFSAEQVMGLRDAMGPVQAMKFIHNLSTKLGEHNFVGGDTNKPGMPLKLSPEAAKMKLAQLMKDKDFTSRLMAKDPEAVKTWNEVNSFNFRAAGT